MGAQLVVTIHVLIGCDDTSVYSRQLRTVFCKHDHELKTYFSNSFMVKLIMYFIKVSVRSFFYALHLLKHSMTTR